MKRRDDGGRGDVTDEQWTKIKPLLPRGKHGQGNQPLTIAELSTAYSGCTARVHHGEISRNATAIIEPFPVGFIGGEKQGFGDSSGQA